MKAKSKDTIRWMIRRDLPIVLDIEREAYKDPWDEAEFVRHIRQRNTIGMVIDLDDKVAGFMVYELHSQRLHLLSLAVAPEHRRLGLGAAMIEKLKSKLAYQRRNRIMCWVSEYDLKTQLFLRAQAFRAVDTCNHNFDHAREQDGESYLFVYRTPSQTAEQQLHHAKGVCT